MFTVSKVFKVRDQFNLESDTRFVSFNREEDVIRKKYDPDGNTTFVVVGTRNIDEFIKSFENGCSLKSILDRCSLMPVEDKIHYLNQVAGVGADLSDMPTDRTGAFLKLQNAYTENPEVFRLIQNGSTFNEAIKAVFYSDPVVPANENESEVSSNG